MTEIKYSKETLLKAKKMNVHPNFIHLAEMQEKKNRPITYYGKKIISSSFWKWIEKNLYWIIPTLVALVYGYYELSSK